MNWFTRLRAATRTTWGEMSASNRTLFVLLSFVFVVVVIAVATNGTADVGTTPVPIPAAPTKGKVPDMWIGIALGALAFVLTLMSKASFWICVTILWAAGIVSESIEKAEKRLIERAEELLEERAPPKPKDYLDLEFDRIADEKYNSLKGPKRLE